MNLQSANDEWLRIGIWMQPKYGFGNQKLLGDIPQREWWNASESRMDKPKTSDNKSGGARDIESRWINEPEIEKKNQALDRGVIP